MSNNHRLACVMVGLPARGKTYISQKICRYLEWTGTSCRVFNVGQYRRKTAGQHCSSDFFDPNNMDALSLRNEAANLALADMFKWFDSDGGRLAIYDATNTTNERRTRLLSACHEQGVDVMFIESICHDPEVIIHNILEVKLSGPDYVGMDAESATQDFKARMRHYEAAYETLSDPSLSFVKLINVGSLVIINLIRGWWESKIVYFLMNLHTQPRQILFSRHGESIYNTLGYLGGDSDLSSRGQLYAKSLPAAIKRALLGAPRSSNIQNGGDDLPQLTIWTSTLKRTQQTSAYLSFTKLAWKALDELDAGVCDGLTYEEIEKRYPDDYLERDMDKYRYRYRGGESYHDVVVRLEPIIMELERQRNILIIGHQAILRCLYAYFMKIPQSELPYIKIPLHTVISITPRAYGCDEERYSVDIPAVDTHRDPRNPPSVRRGSSNKRPSVYLSNSIPGSPLRTPATPPTHSSLNELHDHGSPHGPSQLGSGGKAKSNPPTIMNLVTTHSYLTDHALDGATTIDGLAVKLKATTLSAVAPGPFPDSPATPLAPFRSLTPVPPLSLDAAHAVSLAGSCSLMGHAFHSSPDLDSVGDEYEDAQESLFVYDVNKPHLLEVEVEDAGANPGVKVTVVEPEPVTELPASSSPALTAYRSGRVSSEVQSLNSEIGEDGDSKKLALHQKSSGSPLIMASSDSPAEHAVIGGRVVP